MHALYSQVLGQNWVVGGLDLVPEPEAGDPCNTQSVSIPLGIEDTEEKLLNYKRWWES